MSKRGRKKHRWRRRKKSRHAEKLLEKLPRLEKRERATQTKLGRAQEELEAVPYYDLDGERRARGKVRRLIHNQAQIQQAKKQVLAWLQRNPRKVATVLKVEREVYPRPRKRNDGGRCQWHYPTGGRCQRKVAVKGGWFCEEHEEAYARLQERRDRDQ